MKTGKDIIPVPDSTLVETTLLAELCCPGYNGQICTVSEILDRSMFGYEPAGKLWDAMVARAMAGMSIDISAIYPLCDSDFAAKLVGVYTTVSASPASITEHARCVRNLNYARKAFSFAAGLLNKASGGNFTEEDFQGEIRTISDDLNVGVRRGSAIPVGQLVDKVVRQSREEGVSISTGIATLDTDFDGGWQGGSLNIMAARPSVGKTSLAIQFARKAAEDGHGVSVFSLEMTQVEIMRKLIMAEVGLAGCSFMDDDLAAGCHDVFDRMPLVIDDRSVSLPDIVNKIYILNRQGLCDLAVIDYLGLITGARQSRQETTSEVLGHVTHRFKLLAKELNIPVLLLCQLNRDLAKNGDRPPELRDLRGSGDIEQDADRVIMLARPGGTLSGSSRLDVYVRKNRQGVVRSQPIELYSDPQFVDFCERVRNNDFDENMNDFLTR